MTISVAKDYSPFVLGRYPTDSDFNGTGFREEYLLPALLKLADNKIETLTVDLDGTYGYDPSFLEETFGGSVRELQKRGIDSTNIWKRKVIIKDSDQAEYQAIQGYIKDAINA